MEFFYAFDRMSGKVEWFTVVGPVAGEANWGSAADEKYIYTAVPNMGFQKYVLPDGRVCCSGSWAALDLSGKLIWQTPVPHELPLDQCTKPTYFPGAIGAVTVGNGVVYGASFIGTFVAMETTTGKILWTFESNHTPTAGGPSVADEWLFFGAGAWDPPPAGGGGFYAFSI